MNADEFSLTVFSSLQDFFLQPSHSASYSHHCCPCPSLCYTFFWTSSAWKMTVMGKTVMAMMMATMTVRSTAAAAPITIICRMSISAARASCQDQLRARGMVDSTLRKRSSGSRYQSPPSGSSWRSSSHHQKPVNEHGVKQSGLQHSTSSVINRPSVAGAVLQTPSWLIN